MLLIGGGGGVGIDDFLLTIFDLLFTLPLADVPYLGVAGEER